MMDGKCYESGRVLVFQWRLKDLPEQFTVMSDMIQFMGLKAFRFALKRCTNNRRQQTVLYFIGSNLHKLGVKVSKVYVSFKGSRSGVNVHMKPANDNEVDHLQMFTLDITFKLKEEETISFGVHIVETIDSYRFHLFDKLWSSQLWQAAKNKHWTDVEFAVKSSIFAAHRAIVAARSPIFAALDVANTRIKIDGIEPPTFFTFLRFIYKGVFRPKAGTSIEELLSLADKYQVQTLKTLCESAMEDVDANQLTAFAMAVKPNFELCTKKPQADNKNKPKSFVVLRKHYTVIECVWTVDALPEKSQVFTSELLHFRHDGAFRAGLADHSTRKTPTLLSPEHFLYLACSHLEKTGTALHQVDSYIDGEDHCRMERRGDKALSFFGRELYALSLPCEFKFDILMKETVENYRYELIDSLCSVDMWAAFENGLHADVELIVGDSSFPAHRAIIGARSPLLANLLDSPTMESVTGRIRIDDASPDVFRQFLYFLYTGSVQVSANSRALLRLAERYQVETLVDLCSNASQEVDIEELSASLIWL